MIKNNGLLLNKSVFEVVKILLSEEVDLKDAIQKRGRLFDDAVVLSQSLYALECQVVEAARMRILAVVIPCLEDLAKTIEKDRSKTMRDELKSWLLREALDFGDPDTEIKRLFRVSSQKAANTYLMRLFGKIL